MRDLVQFSGRVLRKAGRMALVRVLGFVVVHGVVCAQGTVGDYVVLQTSNGVVLATEMRPLTWGVSSGPPTLYFSVGFSTDETPTPGEILDSLSGTLQTDTGDLTFLLFTLDAFGLAVAPSTPGTDPLDPEDITATPTGFPSLEPVLANQFAFNFSAVLPDAIEGRSATLYFDLFNNQNSLQSLGWFSSEILIPEPSAATLFLAAIGVWWGVRRGFRDHKA